MPLGTQPSPSAQLPVCIPASSIQLYAGVGLQIEFTGRFTQVHRGVWRRHLGDQVQIVRKLLKAEYRQAFAQPFLESVQKAIFWRSETLVHIYGIILDVNLSVIMEYLPLGPLDQYLQDNELPFIDLVEAATNLAKALFYLVVTNTALTQKAHSVTSFFNLSSKGRKGPGPWENSLSEPSSCFTHGQLHPHQVG